MYPTLEQGGWTRVLAQGSGQRYVLFDPKPVSRVLVLVDGAGSFFRSKLQLVSHTDHPGHLRPV